jgi:hypothetical protein
MTAQRHGPTKSPIVGAPSRAGSCGLQGPVFEVTVLSRCRREAAQEDLVAVPQHADFDVNGAATWRRITAAVGQLANNTPSGPVH